MTMGSTWFMSMLKTPFKNALMRSGLNIPHITNSMQISPRTFLGEFHKSDQFLIYFFFKVIYIIYYNLKMSIFLY